MTDEMKANEVIRSADIEVDLGHEGFDHLKTIIVAALEKKGKEERERCAKIVEDFEPDPYWESVEYDILDELANVIRRGES